MSTERLFTWRNPWFAAGVGVTAALVVLSLVAGFMVLPYATTGVQFASLWDAICSAAGVPRATLSSEAPKPIICAPNSRSVFGSARIFAKP